MYVCIGYVDIYRYIYRYRYYIYVIYIYIYIYINVNVNIVTFRLVSFTNYFMNYKSTKITLNNMGNFLC